MRMEEEKMRMEEEKMRMDEEKMRMDEEKMRMEEEKMRMDEEKMRMMEEKECIIREYEEKLQKQHEGANMMQFDDNDEDEVLRMVAVMLNKCHKSQEIESERRWGMCGTEETKHVDQKLCL